MSSYTRRRFIAAGIGAAGLGTLAGCLDETGSSADTSAEASFFVFGDWASQIAGDTAAETLVPVGQHGHGWEPGPQIRTEVQKADLFVRGQEGFQPWADDMVSSLRSDDADVTVVSAGENVSLADSTHSEHDGHEGEHGHHDEESEHGHDGEHDGEGEHSHQGESGHDEHGSHGHEEDHEEDGHGHGHDHGEKDPHFWLDPTLAKTAVGTIEDGFVSVDGDNERTYADNADAYRSRLDELDETFQSTLADASKDVVFVAGHNAYQYLGNRYGFEVRTLTGLSPDARPTPRDIERAQNIIEEHNLEYVCADPLESQRAANQLVAETAASEVLPLTAIPGQTQEWADDDWGYIDVMEQINLDTLQTALNAE